MWVWWSRPRCPWQGPGLRRRDAGVRTGDPRLARPPAGARKGAARRGLRVGDCAHRRSRRLHPARGHRSGLAAWGRRRDSGRDHRLHHVRDGDPDRPAADRAGRRRTRGGGLRPGGRPPRRPARDGNRARGGRPGRTGRAGPHRCSGTRLGVHDAGAGRDGRRPPGGRQRLARRAGPARSADRLRRQQSSRAWRPPAGGPALLGTGPRVGHLDRPDRGLRGLGPDPRPARLRHAVQPQPADQDPGLRAGPPRRADQLPRRRARRLASVRAVSPSPARADPRSRRSGHHRQPDQRLADRRGPAGDDRAGDQLGSLGGAGLPGPPARAGGSRSPGCRPAGRAGPGHRDRDQRQRPDFDAESYPGSRSGRTSLARHRHSWPTAPSRPAAVGTPRSSRPIRPAPS